MKKTVPTGRNTDRKGLYYGDIKHIIEAWDEKYIKGRGKGRNLKTMKDYQLAYGNAAKGRPKAGDEKRKDQVLRQKRNWIMDCRQKWEISLKQVDIYIARRDELLGITADDDNLDTSQKPESGIKTGRSIRRDTTPENVFVPTIAETPARQIGSQFNGSKNPVAHVASPLLGEIERSTHPSTPRSTANINDDPLTPGSGNVIHEEVPHFKSSPLAPAAPEDPKAPNVVEAPASAKVSGITKAPEALASPAHSNA